MVFSLFSHFTAGKIRDYLKAAFHLPEQLTLATWTRGKQWWQSSESARYGTRGNEESAAALERKPEKANSQGFVKSNYTSYCEHVKEQKVCFTNANFTTERLEKL